MQQKITTCSIYNRANGEHKYSLLGASRLKPIGTQKAEIVASKIKCPKFSHCSIATHLDNRPRAKVGRKVALGTVLNQPTLTSWIALHHRE